MSHGGEKPLEGYQQRALPPALTPEHRLAETSRVRGNSGPAVLTLTLFSRRVFLSDRGREKRDDPSVLTQPLS